MKAKKAHQSKGDFPLFITILLILIICFILLLSVINHILDQLIIKKYQHKPKENSVFVTSELLKESNDFNDNFYSILKCFMK